MSFLLIKDSAQRLLSSNPFFCAVIIVLMAMLASCTAPLDTHTTDDSQASTNIIPDWQTQAEADRKSEGCRSCHTKVDAPTMHQSRAVRLGCVDCHGGDADVQRPPGTEKGDQAYRQAENKAHVQPRYPKAWNRSDDPKKSYSANPVRSYTLLNREDPAFIRFVNPGDLRVAKETCGVCHTNEVHQVRTSLMTTSAAFWTAAAYNNGVVEQKVPFLGESYSRDGVPEEIVAGELTPEERAKGALPVLVPLPRWEIMEPGDNFRVFEDGGLIILSQFPDLGNPNPFEEGGKPDIRQSIRGLGTGARISVPVLNLHKTRLNDPHLSFMGTNDHPGDYRSSGCTACHVVYANDGDKWNAGKAYEAYGNLGYSFSSDPTIPKDEPGHPIKHQFTRSIPSSQCIVCHMHQPNVFVNTYLGYTMWDYETDGEHMWPKQQRYPTDAEAWRVLNHNPEEAAIRGKWGDTEFLAKVSELNPKLKHTQFADYHGHGWNFRAVFKRNREGEFLDADDKRIAFDKINGELLKRSVQEDPQEREDHAGIPVHLKDIHLEKGMHCVDCHFVQDNHGNGNLYGEYANAIEIGCVDCHGTINSRATLKTSGTAAPNGGHDLALMRTPWGKRRFVWRDQTTLVQRSMLEEGKEWEVSQVLDSITPGDNNKKFNEKSHRAKTLRKDGGTWSGPSDDSLTDPGNLAHPNERLECYTCHLSWTTACAGCHLPIQANWKKTMNHFEGDKTRNWTSYNPQAVRTDQFILGIHGSIKGGKIAPIRSSSALILSSTNANRERIYIQQPPLSSAGYSSQAFNPHFPHTVRKKETKQCSDCHVSEKNDNNAWMQSVLGQGSNFVNFIGRHAWVAEGTHGFEAVAVTEWDEPQAVIGSYLHKLAYPDYYQRHQDNKQQLKVARHHGGVNILKLQLRGEYLYTASGPGGFRVYDVANVDNKGFSERIVTAPVSPLGQRTYVKTTYATAVALPTTMPVDPTRCYRVNHGRVSPKEPLPEEDCLPENQEQRMHEIYRYAFVTDRVEGLIVVNVDTLADRDPKNNFLRRAVTFNPDGILDGAVNLTLAGNYAYILCDRGMVIVSLDDPLEPKVITELGAPFLVNPKAIDIQFRYAFVLDEQGFKVVNITFPERPQAVDGATIPLDKAHDVYVARTYAYVAAGKQGLVIIDIKNPEAPKAYQTYNADGKLNDAHGVKVGTTNASLFAYVADGHNGLRVVQLTSPETTPGYDGFSPPLMPQLIATYHTHGEALAVSKGLDRDRAVDESGNQVSIFGRLGSRPFRLEEMQRLYLREGKVYKVADEAEGQK